MSNCQTAVEISLTMLTHCVTALFHHNRIFSIYHYIKTVLHYVILIDRHGEKRKKNHGLCWQTRANEPF